MALRPMGIVHNSSTDKMDFKEPVSEIEVFPEYGDVLTVLKRAGSAWSFIFSTASTISTHAPTPRATLRTFW